MRRILLTASLLAPCLAAAPAFAHAILIASTPPDHGDLASGTHTLSFRYNSRIDRERSRLTLEGTNARMVLPLDGGSAPDVLSSKAELSPGAYVVHWQVLATDGHMTRGDVHFTVTPGKPQ